jgi:hypothetical protein
VSTEAGKPGPLYTSADGQTWAEIGWTEGGVTFLPPPASEPMPFARGPLNCTVTFRMDRAHTRRLRRWIRLLGHPGPLCIDGHAYARRRAARKKRR